ncbi:MAG: hypothetical protein AVDCRST_MAG35-1223 [uncultured Quadrisphaera sp.]|uniref:(d)CMP kinase n=1 Tax=uncultured Quadrisphaera sp. TaxID=904978 RepID=A0A6J4P5Y4_9ACTN|nr:MAG: hypothetical protein AVDCRST_MAG35-1223 [uncultured Quadrisphaera sp.]
MTSAVPEATRSATEEAADRALALALSRPSSAGRTRVVAVDGPSGAGKTTFARVLVERAEERLGTAPPLVQMDEIYPGWDGLAASVPVLVERVLEPIAQGHPAAYRRWDWDAERWGTLVAVPLSGLVVVEGSGCGSRPARPYLGALVWVEAPAGLRMGRGLARDGEAYRPHWERWAEQEQALFAAEGTRERADLLLATG